MLRSIAGRRLALVLAALVCLLPQALHADNQAKKGSRMWFLQQWADAVLHHTPGERDAAVQTFDDWTAKDFAELKVSIFSTLTLIRDRTVRTFFLYTQPGQRAGRQVFYSRDEISQLLDVAKALEKFGDNGMLRRGAMLHMDAVVLGSGVDANGRVSRSSFYVIHFADGQELNTEEAIGHWDMGQFLLDQVRPGKSDVRPNPAKDEWVRRWYRTALTYQLSRMQFNLAIVTRALALFPNDPELLFVGGALHETLASPAVQEPFGKSKTPQGTTTGVQTAKGELDTAEDLLRRSTKMDPDFPEARLRLGHVLGELDRHKDALTELQRALPGLKGPQLQYYGHLFTGRSAAALRDEATARAAFERAAALAPAAQSPLLALSQLAYSFGHAEEATAWLTKVTELPALDGDDPWWVYNIAPGRFFDFSRKELVDPLRKESAQ